jgi:hypothetical protein
MPARAPHPYTTGAGTRFRSTRSNGFPIESQIRDDKGRKYEVASPSPPLRNRSRRCGEDAGRSRHSSVARARKGSV